MPTDIFTRRLFQCDKSLWPLPNAKIFLSLRNDLPAKTPVVKVDCRVGHDTFPDAAIVPKVNSLGVDVFENCLINRSITFEVATGGLSSLSDKGLYGNATVFFYNLKIRMLCE